jgi:hypothetical protein
MSLHDVAVRLGIEYTSNQDAENKIAKYIEGKVRKAAKVYISNEGHITGKSFRECLAEVWTFNTEGKMFFIDDNFLLQYFPSITIKPFIFEYFRDGKQHNKVDMDKHGKFQSMTLSLDALEKYHGGPFFESALNEFIAAVYHECDHIFLDTQTMEVVNFETSLLYLMDDAECRAHSRELAYLYTRMLPQERFTYPLLVDLIEKNFPKGHKHRKLITYLTFMNNAATVKFTDDEVNDYIRDNILPGGRSITVKLLKRTYVKYMNYLTFFVQEFNRKK